tara:strand:- start:12430 stop:12699 length:270 start_codon:yes stop_codon:yes gene_type:complete
MIKYAVIKIEELPKIDFTELQQDSFETCTKSINKLKCLISFYDENKPSFFNDIIFENILGRYFFTPEEVTNFQNVLPAEMLDEWIEKTP